jgi:predicted ester cyclase
MKSSINRSAEQKGRMAIVEAFVEEYKNQHNWDCVDTYLAEDCEHHLPLAGLPPGREGMRVNGQMVCTAFPDVYVTREFAVIENDIVVERAHAKATHKAELMGIPATNNQVTWSELHAYRVDGDRITEIWTEADFLGIMAQIGAVKMPA